MRPTYTLKHFEIAVVAFFVALGLGTIAFRITMGGTVFDAFYRTTTTISFTGLDSRPPHVGGQTVTIVVILAGMAIYGYLASSIVELIAQGVLGGVLTERRRNRVIRGMRDHYIICGYGRVGRRVGREFREASVPYIVLDFTPSSKHFAEGDGVPYVEGTGTRDEDLDVVGLAHAKGLVASSDSDVDNLYIVVSARAARPDLFICARASTEDAARKMWRAGADRVVQPYSSAGQEMAKLVLRPEVAAFLDIVTSAGGPDLRMEEIEITERCANAGRSIRDLRVARETGALIVALRKPDGSFETTPSADAVIERGDVLIAVGTASELQALEGMFEPRQTVAG
ncbi:MAG TPA: NAD-binding protein [Gaiellaceae bacterium]|nr:NAD-binding protein [Gaiellaceae bacterium]